MKVQRTGRVVRFDDLEGGAVFEFCDSEVRTLSGILYPKDNLFLKGYNRSVMIRLQDGKVWDHIELEVPTKRVYGTFIEDGLL
jgi:hypothetical protein